MPVFVGPRWRAGVDEGETFLRVEAGRIVDEGAGARPGARPVAILDGLHNYHTHVGDAFLWGRRLPKSLDALVRPGTGYKHRRLARAPPRLQAEAIRRALREFARRGTASLLDFREQGIAGIRMVRDVLRRHAEITIRLLGRPTRDPPASGELESLVEQADGIGLPAVSDLGQETLDRSARAAHQASKPFALHASEQRREGIDAVLGLRPDLLVHLCAATDRDLRRVADEDVPVAVCPTSNAYFRLRSPVAALARRGIRFYIGTDNAMLGGFDLVREVVRAKRWAPRVGDAEFLRALTTPPEKAIKRIGPLPAPAAPERLVLLPRRRGRVGWAQRPLVVSR